MRRIYYLYDEHFERSGETLTPSRNFHHADFLMSVKAMKRLRAFFHFMAIATLSLLPIALK